MAHGPSLSILPGFRGEIHAVCAHCGQALPVDADYCPAGGTPMRWIGIAGNRAMAIRSSIPPISFIQMRKGAIQMKLLCGGGIAKPGIRVRLPAIVLVVPPWCPRGSGFRGTLI